ncbi:right-handed parallel beta-helix repeat-containing protein [Shewanella sedimentimangrovi]|uniref:Right-handed parallel beta-helix repeat-containing protein n=1 Tax=Shewanella sedimentimangrovi TaxID=2814293 RepID=A0ABX7R236_9GAMM|nr:right-handed parallel beta-helix repeat-containing protein [Shewanella sedimentimangrovi]QSX37549.1 right-handed parallel beta-helix repeat-containing protein [Shewanella sedimentimangrovi]
MKHFRYVFACLFLSAFYSKADSIESHSGTISSRTTWSADSVHIIQGNVEVATGVELVIEAGAVVKFHSGTRLYVNGALNAVGEAGRRIYFTSYRDDSVGGDSNGDGYSQGAAGDWQGIYFSDTVADSLTRLSFVEQRFAGGNNISALQLYGASIHISDSIIRDSGYRGVEFTNANAVLERNQIITTGDAGIWVGYSSNPLLKDNLISGAKTQGIRVEASNAAPELVGNRVEHSGDWGVYFRYAVSGPVLKGNTLVDNRRPLAVPASMMPAVSDGNVLLPNENNSILLLGQGLSRDMSLEILQGDEQRLNTYVIAGALTVNNGRVLTVQPGVVVKFLPSAELSVSGALDSQGTAEAPIVYTSYADDSVGGDSNLNGYDSSPASGDWRGIRWNDAATDNQSHLSHMQVRYAGQDSRAALEFSQSHQTLSDVEISNSGDRGLYSYYSNLLLNRVALIANQRQGLSSFYGNISGQDVTAYLNAEQGLYANRGSVVLDGGEIFANGGYGAYGENSTSIALNDFWWGAADGPGGEGSGSGDEINAVVSAGSPRQDGTEFAYLNAGGGDAVGRLAQISVVRGTASSEWGSGPREQILFDLDKVELRLQGLDVSKNYSLHVTNLNKDAVGSGCTDCLNRQHLEDGNGQVLQPTKTSPIRPSTFQYNLPATAITAGEARLQFVRDGGYRAAVAEILLVEQQNRGDTVQNVSITSPAAEAFLGQTSITVKGVASDTDTAASMVEVGTRKSGSQHFDWAPVSYWLNGGAWEYVWRLPADGLYEVQARVINPEQTSYSNVIAVTVDQTKPSAVAFVSGADVANDDGSAIAVHWGASASSDVAFYDLERRTTDGGFESVAEIASTQYEFVDSGVTANKAYVYRVFARDKANNRSVGVSSDEVFAKDNRGDSQAPEDATDLRWVRGDEEVYLSWQQSADSDRDLVGYLLDVSADDGVSWGAVAPVFGDGGTLSLGKYNADYLVDGLNNGQAYRFRLRALDGAGNISQGIVSGAVIPEANAVTRVSGTLSEDTHWRTGVYYITGDITVPAGVTLTIHPGVVVKLGAGRKVTVSGRLDSLGTEAEPVHITAFTDDSVGGDSNGDGSATVGAAGYWGYLDANYKGSINLVHTQVRYGGSYGILVSPAGWLALDNAEVAYHQGHGIYLSSGSLQSTNSTIHDNGGAGIYAYGSSYTPSLNLLDSRVSHNGEHGLHVVYSSYSVDLQGNTFENNGKYGVFSDSVPRGFVFLGNRVLSNGAAIRLPFSALPGIDDGNEFSANQRQEIELVGTELQHNVRTDGQLTYRLVSGTAQVMAGSLLNIGSGSVWKFHPGTRLYVNGALNAVGEAGRRIYFTSYRDDSVGGDSNGDGYSQGAAGDWQGIYFSDTVADSLTRLSFVEQRFAGGNNISALQLYGASIHISDSIIRDSGYRGVEFTNANAVLERNQIITTGDAGIWVGYSSNPLLKDNLISGAKTQGIRVEASNAAPELVGNRVEHSGDWGVYFRYAVSGPVLKGNTLVDNRRPLAVPASMMPAVSDGNVLLPNENNSILLLGQGLSRDMSLEILQGDEQRLNTYVIAGALTVNNGRVLTVQPGVVVKFLPSAELSVSGALDSQGTAEAPIVYTSYADDSVGGDSNLNGYDSSPASGDWRGIRWNDAATDNQSHLSHMQVRYAGQDSRAALEFSQSHQTLSDVEISNSGDRGLYSYYSNLLLNRVALIANQRQGLSSFYGNISGQDVTAYLNAEQGLYANRGSVVLDGGEIFANGGYGAYGENSTSIALNDFWWGAADGPGGEGSGSGDEINAVVSAGSPRQDGTEFAYLNAGGGDAVGRLAQISVVRGTASSEWGSGPREQILFDLDKVELRLQGLDVSKNYSLHVTNLNKDAVGSGCTDCLNRQHLEDGNGQVLQPTKTSPIRPSTFQYNLPATAITAGEARLQFVRDGGYRAAVAEILLVEQQNRGDTVQNVSITSPAAEAFLGQTSITVKGVASDTDTAASMVEVGTRKSGSQHFDWAPVSYWLNGGAWEYVWRLPADGLYEVQARVINPEQTSYSNVIAVTVDQTKPSAVAFVSGADVANDDGSAIAVHWGASASSDVAFYDLERRTTDGGFESVAEIASTQYEFVDSGVTANKAYVYRVFARDKANNRSVGVSSDEVFAKDNRGDSQAPEDATDLRWVRGDEEVYLSWQQSADSDRDLVGYLLDVSADDGVSWGAVAPVFGDGGTLSLGKYNADYLVDGLNNGQAYRFRLRALDGAGNISQGIVSGAVIPEANAVTRVSGTLSEDTHWRTGVYYITGDITVPAGVTLTIHPGVVVKLGAGRKVTVSGRLDSLGTEAEPVHITAFTDDSVGGDSNGDGSATVGAAGYWGYLDANYKGSINLVHTQVRYGGSYGILVSPAGWLALDNAEVAYHQGHGIYLSSGSLQSTNSTIHDNGGAGIYAYGSSYTPSLNLLDSRVSHNGEHGLHVVYSSYSVDLQGNTFENNGKYGVFSDSVPRGFVFLGNRVLSNGAAIRLPFSALPGIDDGNEFSANQRQEIELVGTELQHNVRTDGQLTYRLVSGTAQVMAGSLLNIGSGSVWKFHPGTRLYVNGALNAVGEAGRRIYFTSYRDDSVGGDSNGDGYSQGAAGDWQGIYFSDTVADSLTRLSFVEQRFAGGNNISALQLYGASIHISDSIIRDSGYRGVEFTNANAVLERNQIITTGDAGIWVGYSSNPLLKDNLISGAKTQGIRVEASNAAPELVGNRVEHSGDWGVYFRYAVSGPVLKGNTLVDNRRPLAVPASMMPAVSDGNVLLPNENNSILLLGQGLSRDMSLEILQGDEQRLNTYVIAGALTVNNGRVLTVQPGVVVKFLPSAELSVSGALDSQGTAEAPIVYTSYADDSVGGDSNLNGYDSSPASGDWRGIRWNDAATDNQSHLSHMQVRYAGQDSRAALEFSQSHQTLSDVEISNSGDRGLYSYYSNLLLNRVALIANQRQGLSSFYGNISGQDVTAYLNAEQGLYANRGSVVLDGGEIFANGGYGAYGENSTSIALNDFWWGAADGPGGEGAGSGDEINAVVSAGSPRQDGTEFAYLNAGGDNSAFYGLALPKVGGYASSSWGSKPYESVNVNADGADIDFEFTGLEPKTYYKLVATFYNHVEDATKQSVYVQDQEINNINLTKRKKVSVSSVISPNFITEGNFSGSIKKEKGVQTVVSELALIKLPQLLNEEQPFISIDSKNVGEIIGKSGVDLTGQFKSYSSQYVIAIGIAKENDEVTWYQVDRTENNLWLSHWNPQETGNYSVIAKIIDEETGIDYSELLNLSVDLSQPEAITDLRATYSESVISLNWSAINGNLADNISQIYRSQNGDAAQLVASIFNDVVAFSDVNIEYGNSYSYFIRVQAKNGNFSDSNIVGPILVGDVKDTTPPNDVISLRAQYSLDDNGVVTGFLSWKPQENELADINEYRIYASINGQNEYRKIASILGRQVNVTLDGLEPGNTYTYKVTSVDRNGNESVGSQSSISIESGKLKVIEVGGTIPGDWQIGAGLYHVTSDLIVPDRKALKISGNAIFKFAPAKSLRVDGELSVTGNTAGSVVFTSYKDDIGGDTNGDGISKPGLGDWSGIYASYADTFILRNVSMEYAGYNGYGLNISYSKSELHNVYLGQFKGQGIYVSGGSLILSESRISNCSDYAVKINYSSNFEISDSVLRDNGAGIYISSGSSTHKIVNNEITSNRGFGIYYQASDTLGTIVNNKIINNARTIRVPAYIFPDSSNILSPNEDQAIYLVGGNFNINAKLPVFEDKTGSMSAVYVVDGNLVLPETSKLIVQAGSIFKFSGNYAFNIKGIVEFNGNSMSPIVMTSNKDDSEGGDTNHDGANTGPQRGDWIGLIIESGAFSRQSKFESVKIAYAGSRDAALVFDGANASVEASNIEITDSSKDGVLLRNSASPSIVHSQISNSYNNGLVYTGNSAGELKFIRIFNNSGSGIDIRDSASPIVNNSRFFANQFAALNSSSSKSILADSNWWGDFDGSGPIADEQSTATGDRIIGNVNYSNYTTPISQELLYVNFDAQGSQIKGNLISPEILRGNLSNEWDLTGRHPGKTALMDPELIEIAFKGLEPSKRYRLGLTLFNGDSSNTLVGVSILGIGELGSRPAPKSVPSSIRFDLPSAAYSEGEFTLNINNLSADTSYRVAVSELTLMEVLDDTMPPVFERVDFDDRDGSRSLSKGDILRFTMSEEVVLLAGYELNPEQLFIFDDNKTFGADANVVFTADKRALNVTIGAGSNILDGDSVSIDGLADHAGFKVLGLQSIHLVDSIAPEFSGIEWLDLDNSGQLTEGDIYRISFSEPMNVNFLRNNSSDANANLKAAGGRKYGSSNRIAWNADWTVVDISITSGYSVQGDELVTPTSFIQDIAGNAIIGSITLLGKDTISPTITAISFNDTDGNGGLSIGDWYRFEFSEPVNRASLSSGTDEANRNLSPEGKLYGTINTIICNQEYDSCNVVITDGFSIEGHEQVIPSDHLTDRSGNKFGNTGVLTTVDSISPEIVKVSASQSSPVDSELPFQVRVVFDGAMNTLTAPDLVFETLGDVHPGVSNGHWITSFFPNDTFEFEPDLLTTELLYPVNISIDGAKDVAGNSMVRVDNAYQFSVRPHKPTLFNIKPYPQSNVVGIPLYLVEGDRQDNTSIYVNGQKVIEVGSGSWAYQLSLFEGMSTFKFSAVNINDVPSRDVMVNFTLDSIAPRINDVVPQNGTSLKTSPEAIFFNFTEEGSGVDLENSSIRLSRDSSVVAGVKSFNEGQIAFTPNEALSEGSYEIVATLADKLGHVSEPNHSYFTIDSTPPALPLVDPVPAVTNIKQLLLTGTKEIGSGIIINGHTISAPDSSQNWQAEWILSPGDNLLYVQALDAAGNVSGNVSLSVRFDDSAPGKVAPIVTSKSTGTGVLIDWSSYDEIANGADIDRYRVYLAPFAYSQSNDAQMIGIVKSPIKVFEKDGLERGKVYYVAVQAVDSAGNSDPVLQPIPVELADTKAPDEAINLAAGRISYDSIEISWLAPVTNAEDLGGFRLYFNEQTAIELPSTVKSYKFENLVKATDYRIRLTTIDVQGNESQGVSKRFATLLDNPTSIRAEGKNGKAQLEWQAALPQALVSGYRVYASEVPFNQITGLQPRVAVSGAVTSATVSGLKNGITYYVGVSVINASGAETPEVTPIAVKPVADTNGPEITQVSWGGGLLNKNEPSLISATGVINTTVADESGVALVEYWLDNQMLGRSSNASLAFPVMGVIEDISDGTHSLVVKAFDSLDNQSELQFAIKVLMAAPPAPVLTAPANHYKTNVTNHIVEVAGQKGTELQLVLNSSGGEWLTTDDAGKAKFTVALQEGENRLTAYARNRGGMSEASQEVLVTVDSSLPQTPVGFYAQSKESGFIGLGWSTSSAQDVIGYNVYRSSSSFSDIAQAQLINPQPIAGATYQDKPHSDGEYFYRVVAVNALGTEGTPSEMIRVISDATLPFATGIYYTPKGSYNEALGIIGAGMLEVRLVVSEPLLTRPFLSLTPEGVAPLTVNMFKVTDFEYQGEVEVPVNYVDAPLYALFSARDKVGNRGTDVKEGEMIRVDTQGPRAQQVKVTPSSPIKNEGEQSVTIDASFAFDEDVDAGSLLLSAVLNDGEPIAIDNVSQNTDGSWHAAFDIPSDWGQDRVENLVIKYQVKDSLGNERAAKLIDNIQVYQGELPPLDAPFGLVAKVQPEGRVALSWYQMTDAAGYRIYRRAVDEAQAVQLVELSNVDSYIDYPTADGEYYYSIASVRQHQGMTSVSALSDEVRVIADSEAPQAPTALTAELYPNGVGLRWQGDAQPGNSYRLYRAGSTEIQDISQLQPIIDNIISLEALDTLPDPTEAGYVVTAVDEAGNESDVSNTAYLNISLLPVNKIKLIKQDEQKPVLSWEHKGEGIQGFILSLKQGELELKLNEIPISDKTFTDTSYVNGHRDYRIIAVDNEGIESLPKEVHLPAIEVKAKEGTFIQKGIMNKLIFKVSNMDNIAINGARLKVDLAEKSHFSAPFTLQPGDAQDVEVIVGGYSQLSGMAQLNVAAQIKPTVSDEILVAKTVEMVVRESGYLLSLETDGFVRGGTGKLRFKLENTSDLEVELETASAAGAKDSRQIEFKVRDLDDNVISTARFRQELGDNVVTIPSGVTLARIAPGNVFVSDWTEIALPLATPELATLEISIGQFSYHLGREEQVLLSGSSTRKQVNTEATPYYGRVTEISPTISFGEQSVQIKGELLDSYTVTPVANAALNLILDINGFERILTLSSDESGAFSYDYLPQKGESGLYKVSAVYPGMSDRPEHGQFRIGGITANYNSYRLSLPKSAKFDVPETVTVLPGADYSQVRWELAEPAPAGISISLPATQDLTAGSVQQTPIGFMADTTASDSGRVVLHLKSASTGDKVLLTLTVDYRLSEAAPVLYYSPAQLETGMTLTGSANEVMTLENRGTLPMDNVSVRLLNLDNSLPPSWAKLSGNISWPSIAVGEQVQLSLQFSPENRANPGIYRFKLRVTAANHDTRDIPVIVAMVEDGIGAIQLKVSDIYTATLNENGELIRGLQGATLSLQNLDVPDIKYQATTDTLGEVYYPDLQAGNYRYRVSAAKHEDLVGEIRIMPGVVRNLDLFMKYALVTVEWVVNEITIEDRYEIVLKGTFETDVPAAVVIMEPFNIKLPSMKKGDVFNGELTLTNYGLVRAEDLRMYLPSSDDFFRYEFLSAVIPDALEAKQSIVVPYRIISLQAYDPSDNEDASGGGCSTYSQCATANYSFSCANGSSSSGGSSACWTSGSCPGGSGVGGGGGWHWGDSGGGGDGWGWGSSDSTNGGMGACREDGDPCNQQSNGGGGDI